MKKVSLFLAIILTLSLALTSCAETETPPASPPDAAESPAETESSYPLTFDNYGRAVTVTAKPERVLALGPNTAELLVALGLGDRIIGTSLRNHSRGPLPEYAAEYENIPELNHSNATREAVISSGADFIYGLDWEFGGSGLDTDELATYGITTYINSATTVELQYREIRDIGKIFGIEDRAEAFIADQQARIAAVKEKIAGSTAPDVLICDSIDAGIFTASGINFASLLLELAGGNNVFGDLNEKAWVTVSYEEVLAREPEVIVIFDYDSPSVEEKIAQIKANDILSQLDAVKNERFVILELESVLPGDRLAYSVEKLSAGFYPDLFK
ncbi:MAG: ABC transporter substrate-binding protein [Oscillospiraceae bacterium]|jgi:iron complex transport system substrate-binding protein|nr:ABC transporter substrate-binding protein [Oscillospiraceae bacterium]